MIAEWDGASLLPLRGFAPPREQGASMSENDFSKIIVDRDRSSNTSRTFSSRPLRARRSEKVAAAPSVY